MPKLKMPSPPPLTLIVATTPVPTSTSTISPAHKPRLGIGQNGTLPWPRIKTDMSFFARVTTRAPQTVPHAVNAIIMGRKTYESIPSKLRPLRGRVSVIVSRDVEGSVKSMVEREIDARNQREQERKVAAPAAAPGPGTGAGEESVTDAKVSSSLETALSDLDRTYGALGKGTLGNVFVIGGGEVYASALRCDPGMRAALGEGRKVRVVMTDVRKRASSSSPETTESGTGFDCDTFFPVEDFGPGTGWRTASADEVTEWVGEEVTGEWIDEGEVSVRMTGYERID